MKMTDETDRDNQELGCPLCGLVMCENDFCIRHGDTEYLWAAYRFGAAQGARDGMEAAAAMFDGETFGPYTHPSVRIRRALALPAGEPSLR